MSALQAGSPVFIIKVKEKGYKTYPHNVDSFSMFKEAKEHLKKLNKNTVDTVQENNSCKKDHQT